MVSVGAQGDWEDSTFLLHLPVDGGVGDDVLETLELPNYQSAVCCIVSTGLPPQKVEMSATDPMDRHRRRIDGIGPFLEEIRHRASWIRSCERLIVRA